jgi:tetratricopeptide (TPR) repeat protein
VRRPNNKESMMMPIRSLIRRAACAIFCLVPLYAGAEALLKPLPTPDTTKLAPDVAKDLEAARAAFEKAKLGFVGDDLAEAYARIGAVYASEGLADIAAIAFYDASQLAPKDSRWLYVRGVVARQQKLNADARADFEAALALDQVYLPIRLRLADTLSDMGDLEGARKLLDAGATQFKDRSVLFAMLGRTEAKQKRYAEAIANFNQALAIEPQANALYADIADAYQAQGNSAQADEARAKVGRGQPTLADPIVAGIYQRALGAQGSPLEQAKRLLASGEIGAAYAKVDEALKANADDVDAVALGARIDALVGRREKAQEEAAHALKIKPDSAAANLSQGMVYEFAGDDANAYTYYQHSVRIDPKSPDAQLLMGNIEMRRAHYAEAAEHYRQLAGIGEENVETTARLVAAQVAGGHCADGLAHVNQLLGKRPKDGDLMQIFVRLASTCAAAQPQERSMALDYALALYKQRPNALDSSALALANAAAGKFDEAQKYQAEAIYEAVRSGNKPLADMYRTTMTQFVAKQVPDRPWPAEHDYFKAPRMEILHLQTQADKPAK